MAAPPAAETALSLNANYVHQMSEEKSIVAAPLPPTPDSSTIGPPPKRRKGRPPKNSALIPGAESGTAPLPPKPDGRGRKPKQKIGDVVWPTVDNAYVGQQVHGVLDGFFDAGYLLTVRVGNTQTVLRGAVFEPSLSVPISQANDIAPNVKFISRGELAAPSLPYPTEHANISPALPLPSSVAALPLVNAGDIERDRVPRDEDKRPPSNSPSAEAPCARVGVATEEPQSTVPPPQSSHRVTEEKRDDLHAQPQVQTN